MLFCALTVFVRLKLIRKKKINWLEIVLIASYTILLIVWAP